ncbi:arginyl-tRNA--protein transferase 1 isoform X1 [Contarinia nasturtii]|uniref:arginyl-tRNA--protein transferase 1 isoform X1 n=1 Tax=Contarinia nasturtii TaxID=265458 RepID=UPI0012D3B3D7|nr:arginyl-tRNA--protein transferase 1 isoform X1 [Contarinia nasturtii]
MSRKATIVNYYGPQGNSRCGYCNNSNSSQSHGMWAHCMTAADYQDLIDRGWRRSGQYCYKPNNKITCCPCYTIKCDAPALHLSKSHKKILKKMNNFLRTGQKSGGNNDSKNDDADNDAKNNSNVDINDDDVKMDMMQPTEVGESSALAECKMITSNQPKESIDIDNMLEIIENTENDVNKQKPSTSSAATKIDEPQTKKAETSDNCNKNNKRGLVVGADPTKPLQPKAKLLRQQRKAEKLLAKTNASGMASNDDASETAIVAKKSPNNITKDLKSMIDEMPTDGVHKLKLLVVNVESDEFKRSQNTEFDLYMKYQTLVHRDPPTDLSEFLDFLCISPIKHETPENGPQCGYGSFHQQYWLDDQLIAVGVIDILPKCVSSVYFFYDPDFSFLTLGTYGTLREVQFVRELCDTRPELSAYYMGFYIHSCPKMRYKGKLQPSYLLCPEIYTWHLLDADLLKLLDETKYSRFNLDPVAKDLNEFNPADDLSNLRLLVDYKYCLTYRDYRAYKGTEGTDSEEDDNDNFTEYGKLVGKVLSRRLYLVT